MAENITDLLKQAVEESGGEQQTLVQTGRGGSGKLRNFKAMNDGKLATVLATVRAENNDPEALEKVEAEARTRGLA